MNGYHLLVLCALLAVTALAGCASRGGSSLPIADLREIPQDCQKALGPGFSDRTLISPADQARMARQYRERILSPWADGFSPRPVDEIRALFDKYTRAPGCGENLQPHGPGWAARMLPQADLARYPNCRRRAITVRYTSIRQLPTVEPVFLRPGQGLGYPFDRIQESALWADTPIFVAHVSKDGSWVWAQSAFSAGWVRASDVAFVDDATVRAWRTRPLTAIVRDGVSLRSPDGAFIATEYIGAVLPLAGQGNPRNGSGEDVMAAVRMPDGAARIESVTLPAGSAEPFPLPATAGRLADLADRMLGQPYGWGGLYRQRDCSAMTRDLFAPLGLYLPRNSSEQAHAGKVIPLAGMAPEAKQQKILRDGVPMLTLLAAPGHIMLYLGRRDGKALILHSTWGVKVHRSDGSEGFKRIAKCCITTLQPGAELPNIVLPDADLRHAITAMILIGPAAHGKSAPAEGDK